MAMTLPVFRFDPDAVEHEAPVDLVEGTVIDLVTREGVISCTIGPRVRPMAPIPYLHIGFGA